MQLAALSSIFLFFVALGCSAHTTQNTENSGAGGTPGGTGTPDVGGGDPGSGGGGGDIVLAGGGGIPTTEGALGCSEAAKLIYVLSEENDLYSFQPNQKKFTKIGRLGCKVTGSMYPNSMAIDRDAVAWVNYVKVDEFAGRDTAGSIFKVSTKDASCQPTNITLSKGWYRLGMGFSTNDTTGKSETLFVTGTGANDDDSPGLGRIDFGKMAVTPIGNFSGELAGRNAELTGTGDARLYGFFTTTPVKLSEIKKETGEILSTQSFAKVETPTSWAFSFWGGDFYFYTAPNAQTNPGRTTNVTRYSPKAKLIETTFMTNIGFRIVGAGVSTCAPLEQPK